MGERWIVDADGPAPIVLPHSSPLGAVHVIGVETPPPAPRTAIATRPEGALPVNREHELRDVRLTLSVHPVFDQWAGADRDFGSPAPEAEGDGVLLGWTGSTRRASLGSESLAAIADVQQMLGGMGSASTGVAGTLTRVLADGRRATLDVVEVLDDGIRWDLAWYIGRHTEIVLTLRCLPYWRSAEQLLGSATRTAGQRLTLVTGSVPGDVDALARIELSGVTFDQQSVVYSIDELRPGGLEMACSDLTRPTGSTLITAAGSVSAQVARSLAVSGPVPVAAWDPVASLATVTGPLSRTGRYRVFARVSGQDARLRLRWAAGPREAGLTANAPVTVSERSGGWALADLGIVTCEGHLTGALEAVLPRPEILLDRLIFVPVDGKAAVVSATPGDPETTIAVSDQMTGSGALVGSAAPPTGAAWSAAYAAGTAWVRTSSGVSRTAAAGTWRADGVPISAWTSLTARCGVGLTTQDDDPLEQSLTAALVVGNSTGLAALASTSTAVSGAWGLAVGYRSGYRDGLFAAYPRVWLARGGQVRQSWLLDPVLQSGIPADPRSLEFSLTGTRLDLRMNFGPDGGLGIRSVAWMTTLPALPPTTGLLAGVGSSGATRSGASQPVTIRDVVVYRSATTPDAALAAGQSSRIATGDISRVAGSGVRGALVPRGDRPLLPAAGRAGTAARVAVMTTRGSLDGQIDTSASDPLAVSVYMTPRWLQIPGDGG